MTSTVRISRRILLRRNSFMGLSEL